VYKIIKSLLSKTKRYVGRIVARAPIMLIEFLIDKRQYMLADFVIKCSIWLASFLRFKLSYFTGIFVRMFDRLHSFGNAWGRDPLLSDKYFLEYLKHNENIEDLSKKFLPNTIYKWLNDNAQWRDLTGVERVKPSDRPLRVLVVSANWNFLKEPCSILEDAGFELRYLPFQPLAEAMNVRDSNGMIFNLGVTSFTQEQVSITLNEKAPWASELVDWCDIVFVDWWSKPAIFFSRYLEKNKPLVVRLHSYEAFSSTPHFTNMKGVDAGIFIADHIKEIFHLTCLNANQYKDRHRVIQNIRCFEKNSLKKRTEIEKRTLCLAGYSTKNKDPILALDILSLLLQDDSRWRLKLIGSPWPVEVSGEELEYFSKFKQKLSILAGNVEILPFTNNLLEELETCGFILSTSLREGSHETVVEGMSVGCIPIVRNWPHVRDFDAAKRMFPNVVPFENSKAAYHQITNSINEYDKLSENYSEDAYNMYHASKSGQELVNLFLDLYE